MTKEIFDQQQPPIAQYNIVQLQDIKTQTTSDKKVLVFVKPMILLRQDVDVKLGESEDGQTSKVEPQEMAIPEKQEEEMDIDQDVLDDEPELSVKP